YLRLLADAHQNYALHGLILAHVAELAQPRRVADLHVGQVLHVDRDAALFGDDDVADILQLAHQAEAADVVKLPALRIEAASGVGVVAGELLRNLRHGYAVLEELGRIQQHLILHGGAAEAGVVGHALNGTVAAFDDPVLERLQLLRAAVGTLQNVTVDQAAGAEHRGETGLQPCRKARGAHPLEGQLAHEIRIGAIVEIHGDERQTIERDRTQRVEPRNAVQLDFNRDGDQPFDFLGRVARPLGDQL